MTDLELAVIAKTHACIEIANKKLKKNFPIPDVRFDIRGKTAGMALLQKWVLRFNPVLLKENPDAFLQDVVPHEVSHLIVFARFGKVRPHGLEWQHTMISLFQCDPATYHEFDVSSVVGKHYAYQCRCGVIQLSVRRHNKVQRNQTQYQCRKCKQTLTFSANEQ